jgi:hypothetical protein
VQPAAQQGLHHHGGEIVLGADRAGETVAGAAGDTGVSAGTLGVVDRQRKPERPAAELTCGALDPLRDRRQLHRRLRVGRAATRLRRIGTRLARDAEDPFGLGVVGLERGVGKGPPRPGVAGDLGIVLEVLGAETESDTAVEHRRATDAVKRAGRGISRVVSQPVG